MDQTNYQSLPILFNTPRLEDIERVFSPGLLLRWQSGGLINKGDITWSLSLLILLYLGKNKDSMNPVQDYVVGVHKFAELADYLVINISSPNTPGIYI